MYWDMELMSVEQNTKPHLLYLCIDNHYCMGLLIYHINQVLRKLVLLMICRQNTLNKKYWRIIKYLHDLEWNHETCNKFIHPSSILELPVSLLIRKCLGECDFMQHHVLCSTMYSKLPEVQMYSK